jgi:hypothetical protein
MRVAIAVLLIAFVAAAFAAEANAVANPVAKPVFSWIARGYNAVRPYVPAIIEHAPTVINGVKTAYCWFRSC